MVRIAERPVSTPANNMSDFITIREEGWTACVRQAECAAIAEAVMYGKACDPIEKGGRGCVWRFPYGKSWGIVRVYRRGGAMRHLLQYHYLLRNRALRELEIHRFVFANGLPTPEPLGACWRRTGLWFRGAIATRELDAVSLLERLAKMREGQAKLMQSCGKVFRQMHDLGIYHADLHTGNVLIEGRNVHVIDFDKAFAARRLSALQRSQNLFRFRRSLEKHGLPMTLFEALCEGYGPAALPSWIGRVYRIKGRASDWASGR